MENSRKINKMKLVFGIAIPMLVIVVTMVMVGVSFAWFSNSENVTVSEITFSTAESYSVSFTATAGDNMPYAGQYALKYDAAKDGGVLITPDMDDNDAPFYFVNTIYLNTAGNTFNLSMAFDWVRIYKPALGSNGVIQKDDLGKIVGNDIKTYGEAVNSNPVGEIPYAFTWMFKKHIEGTTATNSNDEGESLKPLAPKSGETWYTPYGTLEFDTNGKLSKVNGVENVSSIGEPCSIADFKTENGEYGEAYDFYIIFAPEKMFYMQFFSGNQDATLQNTYVTVDENNNVKANDVIIIQKICGTSQNHMYYSDIAYSGAYFDFTALISIEEGGKA